HHCPQVAVRRHQHVGLEDLRCELGRGRTRDERAGRIAVAQDVRKRGSDLGVVDDGLQLATGLSGLSWKPATLMASHPGIASTGGVSGEPARHTAQSRQKLYLLTFALLNVVSVFWQ